MVEGEISICVNLSTVDLHSIEAFCATEEIDQNPPGQRIDRRWLARKSDRLYEASKISSGKGAEILGVSLREFLEMLEKRSVPSNWISDSIKEYMKGTPEGCSTEKTKTSKIIAKRRANCSSANIHNPPLESPFDTSELYDTYCRDCEWSGDISLDLPFSEGEDAKQKRKKAGNNYGVNHEDAKRNNSNP